MAITEGAIIAVSGADGSSTSYTSSTFDSTGGGAILYFIAHEGASTTYTWSDNKSTSSGNFLSLGTVNHSNGDMSISAMVVWSPSVGTGHTITVTFGASRPYRYGGGVVLNGTFASASILAATTQTAQSAGSTPCDAGSLVTDAAAYLFHCACNYTGNTMDSAGTGWTIKSNATGGRHFQARNEASSGTFDPSFPMVASPQWATIAAAIKEASGGGRTTKNTRSWNLGVNVGMGHRMPV